MAAFHLIATLMVLQGVLFSYSMALDDGSTPDDGMTPDDGSGPADGPIVKLNLTVCIDCSGVNLQKLTDSLECDIKEVYKCANFPIHTVDVMGGCEEDNQLFNAMVTLSFNRGIPSGKIIKGVFQDALMKRNISDLTASNTNFTIMFIGVTFTYSPKDGQCQAICCDGAGGALMLERECNPENKCEGIEPHEKEEEGHCPEEEKDTCPDTCEEEDTGSGGIHNSPSYALVTLLAIATFTKTMFF